MKLPFLHSLFARLMFIWLAGITLVLAISFSLFIGERERIGRDAMFEGLAQEIAAAVHILDRLPPHERSAWINDLSGRRLRLTLSPPHGRTKPVERSHPLYTALQKALPQYTVDVYALQRHQDHQILAATIKLTDGSRVSARLFGFGINNPAQGSPAPPLNRLLAGLAALIGGITLLTWFAVRIATRPLSRMAAAARALGENPERQPMSISGPTEVALAATAFNQMQQRILHHVSERTRILAAISHDLQTPITRLRLRAELIEEDTLRSRIQADLDAMQALIREGLDYARSMETSSPPQPVDLNSLAEALRDDATDMGWQVTLSGSISTPCMAQPITLRRALWNLIENGIKFGEHVDLQLSSSATRAEIYIRDYGPGLPEAELEKVFEPFYRTETSRNRETGGTGLGLAIARNLLTAQGGSISLTNHPEGGLKAVVHLPLVLKKMP